MRRLLMLVVALTLVVGVVAAVPPVQPKAAEALQAYDWTGAEDCTSQGKKVALRLRFRDEPFGSDFKPHNTTVRANGVKAGVPNYWWYSTLGWVTSSFYYQTKLTIYTQAGSISSAEAWTSIPVFASFYIYSFCY